MFIRTLLLSCGLAATAIAQSSDTTSSSSQSSSSDSSSGSTTTSGSASLILLTGSVAATSFTGTYATDTSQITVSQSSDILNANPTSTSSTSGNGTITGSVTSMTTTTKGSTSEITLLEGGGVGVVTLSVINGTTTISPSATSAATRTSSTSTSASATNTQACNNYPEFCSRKYSNITEVCAHNSAFSIKNNAADNQALSITEMLDDGIRMIQGETHYVNDTIYSCHTSCNLLNAGTFESEMAEVAAWVKTHPYDVVTILVVNSDYVNVNNYTAPFVNSGLEPYLYIPPKIPMHLDDWPTLTEMILSGKRVVAFMDYDANQTAVPYILDEFTHMFETPFSPTNASFPCTLQRPPTLTNTTTARDEYMYIANHNLNQDFSLFGTSILLPNTAILNVTNAATNQYGTLGAMADNCTADWGRAPNFLLVDYYDVGNGSVFEVAAQHNGVTYNRVCCGVSTSAASHSKRSPYAFVAAAVVATVFLML